MPDFQANVSHVTPPEVWVLPLNRYQRDNLLQLLGLLGYMDRAVPPFDIMNNGDWVGEIVWMLGKKDTNASGPGVTASFAIDDRDHPNATRESIEARINAWRSVPIEIIEKWVDAWYNAAYRDGARVRAQHLKTLSDSLFNHLKHRLDPGER